MTLRHIDPRSIDWMDAMLEGEPARRPGKEAAHEPLKQAEPVETIVALQQATAPPGPGLAGAKL